MKGYDAYIICTSPRSGSTLLCKLLAATGKSGNPDSHFHSPSVSDWMGYYEISSGDFTSDVDLLTAIFQAARDRGTGDTGIFGLRMQRHSFDFFIKKLCAICTDGPAGSEVDRIQNYFGKTLFIHLTRQNKLDQAISLVKASQTGLWHRAPDGTEIQLLSAEKELVYDGYAIACNLAKLTDMEAQWMSWFADQGMKPLRICYNDLSVDPAGMLTKILYHLGVDQVNAYSIDMPIAKLADETSKLWATRFLAEWHCQDKSHS